MGLSLTTFAIELVNFLVLLYLLRRLLYQPLQRGIRERREELATTRARAEQQLAELEQERQDLKRRRDDLNALRQNVLAEASEQAAEERTRVIEQAREDAASELQRAQRLVESERESTRVRVRDETLDLSTELAGRLLLSLNTDAAESAFLEALVEALAAAAPADPTAPGSVELTCARKPSEACVQRLRKECERLAPGARWRLETDSSLQAGCVVRIGSHVFDASLSGRLRVLQERARQLLSEASMTTPDAQFTPEEARLARQ